MVVGEPQILGQLKDQYAAAAAIGAVGPGPASLFHKSFAVAKRVRTETGIAEQGRCRSARRRSTWRARSSTGSTTSAPLLARRRRDGRAARHGSCSRRASARSWSRNRTLDRAVAAGARASAASPVPFERARPLPAARRRGASRAASGDEFLLRPQTVARGAARAPPTARCSSSTSACRATSTRRSTRSTTSTSTTSTTSRAWSRTIADERGARGGRGRGDRRGRGRAFWRWFAACDVVPDDRRAARRARERSAAASSNVPWRRSVLATPVSRRRIERADAAPS